MINETKMTGKYAGWLIVSDFDDTLRPEGAQGDISEADREAIEGFMAGGGRFTVATGRDLCSYFSIREHFPHNAPVILSNGALIAARSGEILWESTLPERARGDLKDMLAQFPEAGAEVHRGPEAFVARRTAAVEAHLGRMGEAIRETDIDDIPSPWNKIVLLFPGSFSGRSEDAHSAAAWVNEYRFGFTAVPSGSLVDIVCAGSDKGAAALTLCEMLGADRGKLVAVGDSWNDLTLLAAAKYAFAPEGAAAEVRKAPGVTTLGPCGLCLRDVVRRIG